jgi:hypothetical protein
MACFMTLSSHADGPPYPPSEAILHIRWRWATHGFAAPGSDLWPVTPMADGSHFAAWGDGGGFGGSDTDGRVALGFASIVGGPPDLHGMNLNGGKNPLHPASFPKKGKTSGIAAVDGRLYAFVNMQDHPWPGVTHRLFRSDTGGASWTSAGVDFPPGEGRFHPAKFVNFGPDYSGLPESLGGFVYLCGPREKVRESEPGRLFLARVRRNQLERRGAYEWFCGASDDGSVLWATDFASAGPIFEDSRGVTPGAISFVPGLNRFLLATFHTGPGQLGIFEASALWGPWRTIEYVDEWGGMGREGEGLSCEFPRAWMSADGRRLWCLFSVYGPGAKAGVAAHDRLNWVEADLVVAPH